MTAIPASTTTIAARGPLAPAFAFPVIDLVTGMREATVLAVTAETPTIRSIRLEPPSGYAFRAGQHALLPLNTDAGPDMRPLSIASARPRASSSSRPGSDPARSKVRSSRSSPATG